MCGTRLGWERRVVPRQRPRSQKPGMALMQPRDRSCSGTASVTPLPSETIEPFLRSFFFVQLSLCAARRSPEPQPRRPNRAVFRSDAASAAAIFVDMSLPFFFFTRFWEMGEGLVVSPPPAHSTRLLFSAEARRGCLPGPPPPVPSGDLELHAR